MSEKNTIFTLRISKDKDVQDWWHRIRVKAMQERISINDLIISLLDRWLNERKEG